jgi:tetratricopeptide (TPR) repeat protein
MRAATCFVFALGQSILVAGAAHFAVCAVPAQRDIEQGNAMLARENYEAAARAFSDALKADPRSVDALVKRGVCRIVRRTFDQAAADLTEAIRLAPELEEAYYFRYCAYNCAGRVDDAVRDLRRVRTVPLSPESRGVPDVPKEERRSVLGVPEGVLRRLRDMNAFAAEWCAAATAASRGDGLTASERRRRIDSQPSTAAGFRDRARSLILEEKFDLAVKDLDKVLAMRGQDSDAVVLRALACGATGDLRGAIADANRAIELNRTASRAFSVRALAWLGLGECDRAIKDMNEVIALDPDDVDAYYQRAHIRFTMGDSESALQDVEQAESLSSEHLESLLKYRTER